MKKMSTQFKVGLCLIIIGAIMLIVSIVIYFQADKKAKETLNQNAIEYITEEQDYETEDTSASTNASEVIENSEIATEVVTSEAEVLTTEEFTDITQNPWYQGVNVLLANRHMAERYLSENNVENIDLDNPSSYSPYGVLYDGTVDGEEVTAQFTISGDEISNFMYWPVNFDERPDWLPEGDTNLSYNVEITDVGNSKFDMSYGEHAKFFSAIIKAFGYEDENGCDSQVSMLDCENGDIIIEVFNNGARLRITDAGDRFIVSDEFRGDLKHFSKSEPYNEIFD